MKRQQHSRSSAAEHDCPVVRFDCPLRHGTGSGRQKDRRQGCPDGPQAVDSNDLQEPEPLDSCADSERRIQGRPHLHRRKRPHTPDFSGFGPLSRVFQIAFQGHRPLGSCINTNGPMNLRSQILRRSDYTHWTGDFLQKNITQTLRYEVLIRQLFRNCVRSEKCFKLKTQLSNSRSG